VIELGKGAKLMALTIAGVVCIACSNGGTTAQALKTGHLLGATPIWQQYAILIGSLTSALVVGLVLLAMNQAGTVYSKKNLPGVTIDVSKLTTKDRVLTGPYSSDTTEYHVLNLGNVEKIDPALVKTGDPKSVTPGRYFVAADGTIAYLCDPAVNGKLTAEDDGTDVKSNKYSAPKTQLIALIIDGIFDRNLPWDLVLIGVLIAITLELSGVPALPFAVGVYLPLASTVPIFIGGMLRWAADKITTRTEAESDSSPGVLLGSGYIAGGSIMAVIFAFLQFAPSVPKALDMNQYLGEMVTGNLAALAAFGVLAVILLVIGSRKA
jgi:uncharacterized oligopeptide transporter (OPT) family protein